ncbi:MAG: endo-1,4-beta-xylanase, partial [Thermoanaerobaculales bacterium]
VIGRDGLRAAGARVTYQQISHDFRFGIFGQLASTGQAVYDRMALAGLNFVTAGYYWSSIEPERGQIDFDLIDHQVGVVDLADRGWLIKGHPLTWLYGIAMPDWLKAMDFDELKQASVDHVTTLIAHYKDRVRTWDVNNEAADYWATAGLSRAQVDEYLDAVYSAARAADPSAELVLNSAFDWFGRDRLTERLDGRSSYVTLSIPAFLQRAVDSGVDFDVVGQQLYNGGGITWFHDVGLGPISGAPTHDLGFIAQVLRRLSGFGKPIHVTEISVSSAWDPSWIAAGAGFWHEPWSEEIQADFLEAFYRLCFGTPAVHAVTWWDAADDNSFVNHGGLFRVDGTPKPALLRLESLISGWTSGGEITTGEDGTAAIQGFAGDYRISVELGGEVHERRTHISQEGTTTLIVDLRPRHAPRRATGRVP